MLIQHFFFGAKITLKLPQGSTVFLLDKDEIELVRKFLQLTVELNGDAETEVGKIWEELNREEFPQ